MSKRKFIESLKLEDGAYSNLELHQERVNRTFRTHFSQSTPFQLIDKLPKINIEGLFKVRIVYDVSTVDIEYAAYHQRAISTIEVVEADPHFEYDYKYEDRDYFSSLINQTKADEIIISKGGWITDASYANLAFNDGRNWFTPKTHLLNGVRRQQLLNEGRIKETNIHKNDVRSFKQVSLINAMLDLEDLIIDLSRLDKL